MVAGIAPATRCGGGRERSTVGERGSEGKRGRRRPGGPVAHQGAHAVVGEARGGRPAAIWCSDAGGRGGDERDDSGERRRPSTHESMGRRRRGRRSWRRHRFGSGRPEAMASSTAMRQWRRRPRHRARVRVCERGRAGESEGGAARRRGALILAGGSGIEAQDGGHGGSVATVATGEKTFLRKPPWLNFL